MDTPEIDAFVEAVRNHGWKTKPDPMERVLTMIENRPALLEPLVLAILDHFPTGGTYFDVLLSFLPLDVFPRLVERALSVLAKPSKHEAAENVIAYTSLQCPSALHPHLETIFLLKVNAPYYYFSWPWRGADPTHVPFLCTLFEDKQRPQDVRIAAWFAALEVRLPEVVTLALASAPVDVLPVKPVHYLAEIGIEVTENELRSLYPTSTFHLIFDNPDYPHDMGSPAWQRIHPTWHLSTEDAPVQAFGGCFERNDMGKTPICSWCGGDLHHLITLNPVPSGLGVTKIDRLSLGVCLSCLGWENDASTLFYQHDMSGQVISDIGHTGTQIVPKFPVNPLPPTTLRLAATPERWCWQDWALSNRRENLHRIGGAPCWIQSADYPLCPSCTKHMPFLMQLDSNLAGEWYWGSGGIAYLHWCDSCCVSAVFWQCT